MLIDAKQDLVLTTEGEVIQFMFQFNKSKEEHDKALKFEFDDFGLLEIFDLEEEKMPDLKLIEIKKPDEKDDKSASQT